MDAEVSGGVNDDVGGQDRLPRRPELVGLGGCRRESRRSEPAADRLDCGVRRRVKREQRQRRALRHAGGPPGRRRAHGRGRVDSVGVQDGERLGPGPGELDAQRRPEPSGADEEHVLLRHRGQRRLPDAQVGGAGAGDVARCGRRPRRAVVRAGPHDDGPSDADGPLRCLLGERDEERLCPPIARPAAGRGAGEGPQRGGVGLRRQLAEPGPSDVDRLWLAVLVGRGAVRRAPDLLASAAGQRDEDRHGQRLERRPAGTRRGRGAAEPARAVAVAKLQPRRAAVHAVWRHGAARDDHHQSGRLLEVRAPRLGLRNLPRPVLHHPAVASVRGRLAGAGRVRGKPVETQDLRPLPVQEVGCRRRLRPCVASLL